MNDGGTAARTAMDVYRPATTQGGMADDYNSIWTDYMDTTEEIRNTRNDKQHSDSSTEIDPHRQHEGHHHGTTFIPRSPGTTQQTTVTSTDPRERGRTTSLYSPDEYQLTDNPTTLKHGPPHGISSRQLQTSEDMDTTCISEQPVHILHDGNDRRGPNGCLDGTAKNISIQNAREQSTPMDTADDHHTNARMPTQKRSGPAGTPTSPKRSRPDIDITIDDDDNTHDR